MSEAPGTRDIESATEADLMRGLADLVGEDRVRGFTEVTEIPQVVAGSEAYKEAIANLSKAATELFEIATRLRKEGCSKQVGVVFQTLSSLTGLVRVAEKLMEDGSNIDRRLAVVGNIRLWFKGCSQLIEELGEDQPSSQ